MLDVFFRFLHLSVLTFSLTILFALAGAAIYRMTGMHPEAKNAFWDWGASFYLGLVSYLVFLRFATTIAGSMRIGVYTSLAIMLVLAVIGVRREGLRALVARYWPPFKVSLLLFLAFTLTTLTVWMDTTDEFVERTHLGSIHSGRYANVGIFIVEQDRIPFLNQNFGQSMLVATDLILGCPFPLASLTAWVAMAQTMLTLLIYGLFRALLPTAVRALAATFLVLFCNIALSVTHVLVFDNGSPVAFMGYTDTVCAVATWLLLVTWIYQWTNRNARSPSRMLVPAVILVAAWNWFAPQNIVIGLSLCVMLAIISRVRPWSLAPTRLIVFTALLGLAALIGATQGGMLMPSRWAEKPDLPGMLSPGAGFHLKPGLEFVISHNGLLCWGSGLMNPSDEDLFRHARDTSAAEVYRSMAFRIESHFWTACRVMFFPILGIAGMGFIVVFPQRPTSPGKRVTRGPATAASLGIPPRACKDPSSDKGPDFVRFLTLCASISFVVGFAIAFPVHYNGYKWELTRFMIPGAVLGLVCFGILVNRAEGSIPFRTARRWAWIIVALLATCGPLIEFAILFHSRFLSREGQLFVAKRLHVLFSHNTIMPE